MQKCKLYYSQTGKVKKQKIPRFKRCEETVSLYTLMGRYKPVQGFWTTAHQYM
jgi:hypothetical protein